MQHLYSQGATPFKSGQKFHWGSLYGSAQALALVEFAKTQDRVILVVANDISHFDQWFKSLHFYNTGLEILRFDNWEVLAFDHFSPHPDITSSRLNTLSKLPKLKRGIVITTLESLTQQLCPLEFSEAYSFSLKVGATLELQAFVQRLLKIGYNRVMKVMEHGEFSVKGSLIDIYPMGAKLPCRLDLFDQEIESIRLFDVSTQRSTETTQAVSLLPAREFATDKNSIEVFKENYQKTFDNTGGFIFDEVGESRLPSGIEFYLSLFFTHTNTLFDYLPSESIIATSEGFSALVDLSYDEVNNRHQKASENFDRLPLPIEQVFIEKQQLFSQIKQRQQLLIGSSKNEEKLGHLNFASQLLPSLNINAQNKVPLNKFLIFEKKFSGKILIVCESEGRKSVLSDLLISHELKPNPVEDWQDFLSSDKKLCITNDKLSGGLLTQDIAVITEVNLFGADVVKQQRRRRAKHKDFDEAIKSLVEIQIGDPIVHESYGVGRYLGLKTQTFDGLTQDFLMLEYAKGSKLMVPMTSLNLISRYSGTSPESAPLHKLGTNQWTKAKQKAHEALYDVAAELLEIYAKRQSQRGFAFPAPSDAYGSFVASFPFEETPDQLKTMGEVLADMQSHKPMDRLVCGDVGFGKTEIAMRAAFLAVESGKQVAILVPTTLLANQHYASFQDRFINHPVEIKALSRFQSTKEQTQIKQKLLDGTCDIVIGTHKLIQGSIKYKQLGLVIIDEEHRFGVKQKESLKKMRGRSDILTMTATPIPRTLNMALGSLRELSIIATPPQGRSAIQTFVKEWDDDTIKEACSREMHRGGQIFVLHNDIDSIDNMAESLKSLMKNAHIRIAHGQMPTRELEQIMSDFYHGRFQILVCTTIIETGIDIPNANTIIINNAQNFGLAQLHQLRGRVGRSHHRAYAYLVIKSHQSLSNNARKRLEAVESLEELGAGFMLANHDLEIRGAGDLLGDNQSGKISEIGFNLYHDLLKRTVDAMRVGKKININDPINHAVDIDTGIPCIIPDTYLGDVHERLVLYKRIANGKDNDELKDLTIEMIDRFGLLPDATKNLFAATQLKLSCEKIGIDKVSIYDDKAHIVFSDKVNIEPIKIINLVQTQPKRYQLKGQNQLIFKQEMPDNIERIELIESLLKTLEA
ncbi:transcription-repair coupling factor [bacterium endosymbiont of Bathymodiolus sp. 5 South]|jgi:transcription-repair coupling factor (superfamily II helicase)|uniref:transcription-repair coupling factor n=1 Tax=bacterium endosymbiont of Bathymodiolus sp. 5 South TaxID=1181670 RepID=UPI0010B7CFA0|nr:transcription-repair coupling factor [bacterium endosymbiont of Bathymodiolus sp. 5 South]CAC9646499.1 Transcription-repair coupling factor [uncultured Gammaproteobacteria bacterium]SHN90724.1 Transcription-repair coupling factor [bacterium endosymbiont of Bathymodiolus sp. 5 South]SSC06958.1 Transcription-repair coupling factor [bacterium endosymbiont of Bathymodiolus sp. 5 South]VVH57620.1 Transcription-repair coupling factor [uncultured Gammaproteobacteria bacterium]VVH63745.1 Transcript